MNTNNNPSLDVCLPDHLVIQDLKRIIHVDGDGRIELNSNSLSIDPRVQLELVSKAWIEQRYKIEFGSCFRAVVAIGGVASLDNGIIRAVHCFSTLWYSSDGKLITTDFSTEMPG